MKKLFSTIAVMGLATLGGNFNGDLEQKVDRNKELSSSPVKIEKPQTVLNPDGSKMYFSPVVHIKKPPSDTPDLGLGFFRFGKGHS